ncbi:MAG: SRPBCC family protein [Solirubrobacteraceae bacterium]
MKPINVSVHVDQPREEVYAFLDVLGAHEQFCDHMLVDWSCSGPASGVGAKARMRAKAPGPKQWADMEVKAAQPPRTITEEAVGANGRRRTRGTYVLEEAPAGGTDVRFTLEYLEAPASERLASPLLRVWLTRANEKAMRRLKETLAAR